MRRLELAAYVLLGALIVAGFVLTLVHAADEVYAIPVYGVAIAAGAAIVAAAGAALGWRTRRGRPVALAATAAALGVLALLSFPPLLVLMAALTAIAVVSAKTGPNAGAAITAGALIGVAMPILALIALGPPLVDCKHGAAGENIFLAWNSHAASTSAEARGDIMRGRTVGDKYAFNYTCDGGELTEFELRDR